SATNAGDDTVTATWTADTEKYDAGLAPVAGTEILTDASTINFYAIDYAASHYTMTRSGAASQPIGSTVIETYTALDQLNQPIRGLDVSFFRTGPDDQQDGTGTQNTFTGANGSLVYVFQGTKAGTATVTAIGSNNGTIVPAAQRTDTVTFAAPVVTPPPTTTPPVAGPVAIDARLKGSSTGRIDRIKVIGSREAAGSRVLLFKKVNGKKVRVGKSTLRNNGKMTFKVTDRNGNRATKYIVKITGNSFVKKANARFNLR
ncbi:MAG: hypothetical protein H7269_04840, partial [Cellulomonas sp.]|nr:hypothetical protein [Cellulomonas sp.]